MPMLRSILFRCCYFMLLIFDAVDAVAMLMLLRCCRHTSYAYRADYDMFDITLFAID